MIRSCLGLAALSFSSDRSATSSSSNVRCSGRAAGFAAGSQWKRAALCALALGLFALCAALPSRAATDTVTSLADDGSAGTLRVVLNAASPGDTIVFSVTGTITVTAVLEISENLTISGPGAASLTISGGNACMVFEVNPGVTATISGLTIENGFSASGGGIFNNGKLTVSNTTLSGNSATESGGAIYDNGTLTVNKSTLTGNSASSSTSFVNVFGGGIYVAPGATATVTDSNFSGNVANLSNAAGGGGAIGNLGTLTVSGSAFSGNSTTGGWGGGIYDGAPGTNATIINSTFANNSAVINGQDGGQGGGVYDGGPMTLSNDTFSGNSGNQAQGGGGAIWDKGGTLTMKGTILANSPSGGNCAIYIFSTTATSGGYNLSNDSSCSFLTGTGDQNGVAAGLDTTHGLTNNGGPTPTIALLSSSTAKDAIPYTSCTDPAGNFVATDQRGVYRAQGSACDIGAYELTQVPIANVCPGGAGPAPCSQLITILYNLPVFPSSEAYVTQGAPGLDFLVGSGFCSNSGASFQCLAQPTFAPTAPGLRLGAIEIFDGAQSTLASTLVSGIGEGPAIAFGPGTPTVLTGSVTTPSLNSPEGVAVDAAGNVFIADSQNSRVVKLPAGGGSPTTVGTGLATPAGVALDGAGNLYIVDTGLDAVVVVPALGGAQTTVPASGLLTPVAVAVDGLGDVFIADIGLGQVVEVPANGGIQTTIGTGLSTPQGVAVDAAGDVFIADPGLTEVVKVPAAGGAQTTVPASGLAFPNGVAVDAAGDVFISDAGSNHRVVEVPGDGSAQTTVASDGFQLPSGLALDGTGNVFIADYFADQVVEMVRATPPTLSFGSTAVGSTSSPQSVTVQNIGNQPLVVSSLSVGTNFVQTAGSGSPADCAATGFTLAAGASCNLSVSFKPTSTGPLSAAATFTDNALNATSAQQSVALQGTGVAATVSVTITSSPVTGLQFSSAGTGCAPGSYTTPQILSWTPNSSCTLTFASPQSGGPGTQYAFSHWEDNESDASRNLTAPPSGSATYTATFTPQYLLTTSVYPAGAGTVGTSPSAVGDYYASGTPVTLTATANSGYVFSSWSGGVTSSSNPLIVTMSGPESVTANFTAQAPAVISVTPNALDFGTLDLGSSKSMKLTVKNIGTAAFKIANISFTYGPGTGKDFGYTTQCGGTIKAGKTCTITVTMKAQDLGSGTATLNIAYNLPGSPATVSLMGTVINPKAKLSKSSLNFGNVTVGHSSTLSVVLTSSGDTELDINSITVSGSSTFTSSTCGSTLAPKATCTISVTFTPTAKKSYSGTLKISDNASSSPQTVSLSGKGD